MKRSTILIILIAWISSTVSGIPATFESATLFDNDTKAYVHPPRPARVFVTSRAAEAGNILVVYRYGMESDTSGDDIKTLATNLVVKITTDNTLVWTNRLLPYVFDLTTAPDGTAWVLGNTRYISSVSANQRVLVSSRYFSDHSIPSEGAGSAYIARLSASGVVESVRFIGNSQFLAGTSIDRDSSGNLYVAGYYIPGGTAPPRMGMVSLPAAQANTPNVFLAKFDSAGEVQWVRVMKGTSTYGGFNIRIWPPAVVRVSPGGYAILTIRGTFGVGFSIDQTTFDSAGGAATFDPEGNLLQARVLPFSRGAILDGGSFVTAWLHAPGELLIEKRDSGGQVLWQRSGRINSGTLASETLAVSLDSVNNVIVTGAFGSARFLNCPCDPASLSFESTELRSVAYRDLFVAKYNSSGDFEWALQTEGQDPPFNDYIGRISKTVGASTIDSNGTITLAGTLTGSVLMGNDLLEGGDFSLREDGSGIYVARIAEGDMLRPSVQIERIQNEILVRWPSSAAGYTLETADSLTADTWKPVDGAPLPVGELQEYRANAGERARFFRLRAL